MQVHGQDAVCAGGDQEVGDEFGGDGDSGLVFPILPGIAVEGENGGNPRCAGPAQCVHHDEQLHQVMVRRRTRRLDDIHVLAAHVLLDLDEGLTIRERADSAAAEGNPDRIADCFGQRPIRAARKQFHSAAGGFGSGNTPAVRLADGNPSGGHSNITPVPCKGIFQRRTGRGSTARS